MSLGPSRAGTGGRPALLVTRRLPDAVEARAARDYDARLNPDDIIHDGAGLARLAQGCSGILATTGERFDAATIAALPEGIGIIATYSVGVDHIDLDAARARGIVVTNTPDVLTDATADTTMMLILGAARRAGEGERLVRAGAWKSWTPTLLLGVHVTGKRLCILGMGRIGQAVARRARGFDMEIHYSTRRRLPPELEAGAIPRRAAG
jgi:lactate dehydrogenase-like 2-hydroxyacid dehydrogenase